MYEELGGSSSRGSSSGWDSLVINEEAYQNRVAIFLLLEPTGWPLFSDVMHGKKDKLTRTIEYFYQLTVTLSQGKTISKRSTGKQFNSLMTESTII